MTWRTAGDPDGEGIQFPGRQRCRRTAKVLESIRRRFDIITRDITKPFAETKGVLNEVNTSPGLQCMYQLREDGTEVHIAEIVLRDMFGLRPSRVRNAGSRARYMPQRGVDLFP